MSATITGEYFNKTHTHTHTVFPSNIVTNHQACLAGTQMSNIEKTYEIVLIEKLIIAPIDMEEVRTTEPMVILR